MVHLTETTASTTKPSVWRWTREQYYRIAETGIFEGKRVELVNGEIVEMSPMNSPHWVAVLVIGDTLREAFGANFIISPQLPLDLSETSQPEPDIAVIRGSARDYRESKPTSAVLVVEISDSTLAYERTDKASLYASANIPEYWIVNLVDNQVEVMRRPMPHPTETFGFRYMDMSVHQVPETISPLTASGATIAVTDLLP